MTQKTKDVILAVLEYYMDSASGQEPENYEWAKNAYDEVMLIVPTD